MKLTQIILIRKYKLTIEFLLWYLSVVERVQETFHVFSIQSSCILLQRRRELQSSTIIPDNRYYTKLEQVDRPG